MMDTEIGSNTSVILSLMGIGDRSIQKLVQGHKRVLSDEYHQKVASTAWHVQCSSFKSSSLGRNRDYDSSEASAAIGQNKRCSMSTEDEEMSNVWSDERNALGGKSFIDELISETCSSRNATRQYIAIDNSSEPSTSFPGRYSCHRLLGNSFTGNRDGNPTAYLLKNRNGCRPYSRSIAASSIIYRGRGSQKQNEALHQRSFIISNALCRGEVDGSISQKSNLQDGPLGHNCEFELFSQKSPLKISSMLERNCRPLADHAIEQETPPIDSAECFYTNGSSSEMDSFTTFEDNYLHSPDSVLEPLDEDNLSELSEHQTRLRSFGLTPSTAWSGETRRVSGSKDNKDHCEAGCCKWDSSKHGRISEKREFNYLVEVLTAAGFCGRDLLSSLDKWHSVESPLSPFIFETVEKRYGDDKSWETSERLLLFDRINSWFELTLRPTMFVSYRHVSARISKQFRQLSEDVLWSSLVKEGTELKGKTIEDLLESDLWSTDVVEFIESTVTEIEQEVIEDLIAAAEIE